MTGNLSNPWWTVKLLKIPWELEFLSRLWSEHEEQSLYQLYLQDIPAFAANPIHAGRLSTLIYTYTKAPYLWWFELMRCELKQRARKTAYVHTQILQLTQKLFVYPTTLMSSKSTLLPLIQALVHFMINCR